MYIRNRVDTSPSPVSWSTMCKQLFGFVGFMFFMFYLGHKFPAYQPVVSINQLFVFAHLHFFLSLSYNCHANHYLGLNMFDSETKFMMTTICLHGPVCKLFNEAQLTGHFLFRAVSGFP